MSDVADYHDSPQYAIAASDFLSVSSFKRFKAAEFRNNFTSSAATTPSLLKTVAQDVDDDAHCPIDALAALVGVLAGHTCKC